MPDNDSWVDEADSGWADESQDARAIAPAPGPGYVPPSGVGSLLPKPDQYKSYRRGPAPVPMQNFSRAPLQPAQPPSILPQNVQYDPGHYAQQLDTPDFRPQLQPAGDVFTGTAPTMQDVRDTGQVAANVLGATGNRAVAGAAGAIRTLGAAAFTPGSYSINPAQGGITPTHSTTSPWIDEAAQVSRVAGQAADTLDKDTAERVPGPVAGGLATAESVAPYFVNPAFGAALSGGQRGQDLAEFGADPIGSLMGATAEGALMAKVMPAASNLAGSTNVAADIAGRAVADNTVLSGGDALISAASGDTERAKQEANGIWEPENIAAFGLMHGASHLARSLGAQPDATDARPPTGPPDEAQPRPPQGSAPEGANPRVPVETSEATAGTGRGQRGLEAREPLDPAASADAADFLAKLDEQLAGMDAKQDATATQTDLSPVESWDKHERMRLPGESGDLSRPVTLAEDPLLARAAGHSLTAAHELATPKEFEEPRNAPADRETQEHTSALDAADHATQRTVPLPDVIKSLGDREAPRQRADQAPVSGKQETLEPVRAERNLAAQKLVSNDLAGGGFVRAAAAKNADVSSAKLDETRLLPPVTKENLAPAKLDAAKPTKLAPKVAASRVAAQETLRQISQLHGQNTRADLVRKLAEAHPDLKAQWAGREVSRLLKDGTLVESDAGTIKFQQGAASHAPESETAQLRARIVDLDRQISEADAAGHDTADLEREQETAMSRLTSVRSAATNKPRATDAQPHDDNQDTAVVGQRDTRADVPVRKSAAPAGEDIESRIASEVDSFLADHPNDPAVIPFVANKLKAEGVREGDVRQALEARADKNKLSDVKSAAASHDEDETTSTKPVTPAPGRPPPFKTTIDRTRGGASPIVSMLVDAVKDVGAEVHDLVAKPAVTHGKSDLGNAALRSLGGRTAQDIVRNGLTTEQIASQHPDFGALYDKRAEREQLKSDLAQDVDKLLSPLSRLSAEQNTKVSDVMFTAMDTKVQNVDLPKFLRKNNLDREETAAAHAMIRAGKYILDHRIDAYWHRFQEAPRSTADLRLDATQLRAGSPSPAELSKAAKLDLLASIIDSLEKSKRESYMPRIRKSDASHAVWVSQGGKTLHYEHTSGRRETNIRERELTKQFGQTPNVEALPVERPDDNLEMTEQQIRKIADLANVDPVMTAKFLGAGVADALVKKQFGSHWIMSHDVPGYMRDAKRAWAEYGVRGSHNIASIRMNGEIQDKLADIDPKAKPVLATYAKRWLEEADKPDTSPMAKFVNNARGLIHLYYLAGNAGSASRNQMSSYFYTPHLAHAIYGPSLGKAARVYADAVTQTLAMVPDLARMLHGASQVDTTAAIARKIGKDPALANILEQLHKKGLLGDAGKAEFASAGKSTAGRAWNKLQDIGLYMSAVTERANRIGSAAAAVHMARDMNPGAWGRAKSMGYRGQAGDVSKFAEWFVGLANARYGKSERPAWARTGFKSVAYSFAQWPQRYAENFYTLGLQAAKERDWRKGLAFATWAASNLLLGGVAPSLPGVSNLLSAAGSAASALGDVDILPGQAGWDKWMHEAFASHPELANILSRGIGSQFHGRVGDIAEPLLQTGAGSATPTPSLAAADLVNTAKQGEHDLISAIKYGNPHGIIDAMTDFLPSSVRKTAEAVRMSQRGTEASRGGATLIGQEQGGVDNLDATLHALNLPDRRVQQAREQAQADKNLKQPPELQRFKSVWITDTADAIMSGNHEQILHQQQVLKDYIRAAQVGHHPELLFDPTVDLESEITKRKFGAANPYTVKPAAVPQQRKNLTALAPDLNR